MGVWITAAVVASGLDACARDGGLGAARVPAHSFPVREYTYASGLRVVVEEDDTTPISGVVLVVEAGSADDPPEKAGLAHTVEHLIFRAPAAAGLSFRAASPRLGASSFNATTGIEQTTYFAFVPRASLDDLVATLMGRLADPLRGIDDALVARELPVVAEEIRSRPEYSVRSRAYASLLPVDAPYRRAYVDGDHLDALSLTDVAGFVDRRYRPERMTLVISGAIGAEWDGRLAALLPAPLRDRQSARQPPVRRPAPAGPAVTAPPTDAALPVVKAPVDAPELWLGWPLPPAPGLQQVSLSMMARIADRLIAERVDRSAIGVLSASAGAHSGSKGGAFFIRARLRSGADAETARDAITAWLASLSWMNSHIGREAVPAARRAVREAALRTALTMESLNGRALVRAGLVHQGAGTRLSDVLATIRNVSVTDVALFADHHLKRAQARSVLLLPDDQRAAEPAAPSALRRASLTETVGDDVEPDIEDEAPDEPEGEAPMAWDFGAARARVTRLPNGLTVIALRRPGLPFVSMMLGFRGEPQPGEPPGLRTALPMTSLWRLTPAPLDRGILHQTFVGKDAYVETLTQFSSDAGKALDLIAEQPAWLHVSWPSTRFQRAVDSAAQSETLPATRAYRAYLTALLGDHVYRSAPTADAMRALTGDEIKSWLVRTRRPNNGALVIVGDVDVDEVTRRAAQVLGDWKRDPTLVAAPPAPPVVAPARGPRPRLLFTPDGRRGSTEVRFGCLLPPILTHEQDVRSDILADLMQNELGRRLRLKLGASYGSGVRASSLRGGTALLQGWFDLEDRALPEALDLLRAWLEPGSPSPIKPADLERVRRVHARRSPFHYATNTHVADELLYNWNRGWPLTALDEYPRELARVAARDLEAELDACRASAVISVVGAGPPPGGSAATPAN